MKIIKIDDRDVMSKKKLHHDRHSGRKAEKKKVKKDALNSGLEVSDKQKNPKAFSFNSALRAERRFRRKQDIEIKKQHIPVIDRTSIEPPPILVAVVGPPKVGKSTLINNLIKLFIKMPRTDVKGPVTIVTSKKRRITLIECNNDINAMIDIAKVADLVLLLCDASFGFEMEIFEFLNICQVHGMPRIMGVLTHLDMIKNSKTLKMTKKTLKHRFWTEVYPGAKLFYLSGILHEEYLRNEIKNLGRFISVMKFRPLQWRITHSYLLGDRCEDLTSQELVRQNPKCDRTISLYGYIRGVPLKKEMAVHIAGLGDLKIHDISYLPDPCPLPEQNKKRALIEKEKYIYSPFSGIGGIVYDKDAVYVEVEASRSHNKHQADPEVNNIVANLIQVKETLDVKLEHSTMQLFSEGEKIVAKDLGDNCNEINTPLNEKNIKRENTELESELKELRYEKLNVQNKVPNLDGSERVRRTILFEATKDFTNCFSSQESDDTEDEEYVGSGNINKYDNFFEFPNLKENKHENIYFKVNSILNQLSSKPNIKTHSQKSNIENQEDDVEGVSNFVRDNSQLDRDLDDNIKWKMNLSKKAEASFYAHKENNKNLMRMVYGLFDSKQHSLSVNTEANSDDIGGLFKKVSDNSQKEKLNKNSMNLLESSLIWPWGVATRNWLDVENKTLITDCFVTGRWKESKDAAELLELDNSEDFKDRDSDIFDGFEGYEAGEKRKRNKSEQDKVDDKQLFAEKKRKLKEKFDAEYDNTEKISYYDEWKMTTEKQSQLNKIVFENLTEDERVNIEGFRPGMYVRIEFENVPAEFITHFDPTYPVIIGSLNMGEENIGYVNVKLKKHRWYKKILKSNDPLIISLGWRRFQTLPIYSKLEDDMKYRYLKYTPEHLACNAHFLGPVTPQGTGFIALQVFDSNQEVIKKLGFRIAATGSVQEVDKSVQIMKKLKIIGYPLKIYKKTAFITGMFNSALEVGKFEGARLKTVSGIRGQIKKAVGKPEGCFRATFESRIQLSDIVFCRTWYKVDVIEFYNPVNTLLLPPNEKNAWKGVRTTGEIKREKGIINSVHTDNLYAPIERPLKPFKPLIIPQKLQKALPYKDKPKLGVKLSEKRKCIERIAVVCEPYEQKISTMIKMIKTTYEQKQEKIKKETKERLEVHRQEIVFQEAKKERKLKQKKREIFRKQNKNQIKVGKKVDDE